MKTGIAISITIAIVVIVLFIMKKKKDNSLGKLNLKRPPKVRIVYSKKIKPSERPSIRSSNDAVKIFREIWSKQIEVREEFVVLLMDRSNKVLGYQLLSKGGLTGTIADIRLILAAAIETLASGIILAHNHPSGNIKPSESDRQLTTKIKDAAKLMDIAALDHIIMTRHDFFSFADNGYM